MTDALKESLRKACGSGETARELAKVIEAEIATARKDAVDRLNREPGGTVSEFEIMADSLLTIPKVARKGAKRPIITISEA